MDPSWRAIWDSFALTFIPIFVAIDILGVVPLYLSMISGRAPEERSRIALNATLTAFAVALGFVLLGEAVFQVMGITLDDFRIAGGIILFILATAELVGSDSGRTVSGESVGIFPIGVPLIIGPSALATLLVLHKAHGLPMTLTALAVNMAIVFVVLRYASVVDRILGKAGAQAFAKVANLLLASIGVMMVRRGIEGLIARPR
jgi:multiple antibiotic resistance protein